MYLFIHFNHLLNSLKRFKNVKENLHLFLESGRSGNPFVQYKLGKYYLQDAEQHHHAKKWLYTSYFQGYNKSAFLLGNLYLSRLNYKKSLFYFYESLCLSVQDGEKNSEYFEIYEKDKRFKIPRKDLSKKIFEKITDIFSRVEDFSVIAKYLNKQKIISLLKNEDFFEKLIENENGKFFKNYLNFFNQQKRLGEKVKISEQLLNYFVSRCNDGAAVFSLLASRLARPDFDFDEQNILGRGAFGQVHLGKLFGTIPVAVKIINPLGHPSENHFDIKCFRRECALLKYVFFIYFLHFIFYFSLFIV